MTSSIDLLEAKESINKSKLKERLDIIINKCKLLGTKSYEYDADINKICSFYINKCVDKCKEGDTFKHNRNPDFEFFNRLFSHIQLAKDGNERAFTMPDWFNAYNSSPNMLEEFLDKVDELSK